MPLIPLDCPACDAQIMTDSDDNAAICSRCGKPFIVKDAIIQNYIRLVSGTGAVKPGPVSREEFVIEDGVLKRYNSISPEVIIPADVTVIGRSAFEDCRDIKEVRLSDSVVGIEDNAFAGCDNLQKVYFPGSLKKIGGYAFSECTCLSTVELPDLIEEIGPHAFGGCFMLGRVKMPSAQAKVHETAFAGNKDVFFEWPEGWSRRQLDKLRIAAPAQGGLVGLSGSNPSGDGPFDTLLFLGVSDSSIYVEAGRYNFYTYHGFMNLFSLEKNNNDPYSLRKSVEMAQQMYDAIADIQRSYSDLIGLLDRADISRNTVEMINIPHFIWKQGKRLNDYKVMDIGMVPVLQLRLVQE